MDGTAGTADDVCRVTTLTAARKKCTQALNKRAKLYETEKKAQDKALKSSTDNAEEEKHLRDTKIQLKLRIVTIEVDVKQLMDEISTNETKISKAATSAESNKKALGKLKWDDLAGRTKLVRAKASSVCTRRHARRRFGALGQGRVSGRSATRRFKGLNERRGSNTRQRPKRERCTPWQIN